MNDLINFIFSGNVDLTLEGVVRLIVFLMILECISNIAHSVMKVGGK